jgi:hypothetical protein
MCDDQGIPSTAFDEPWNSHARVMCVEEAVAIATQSHDDLHIRPCLAAVGSLVDVRRLAVAFAAPHPPGALQHLSPTSPSVARHGGRAAYGPPRFAFAIARAQVVGGTNHSVVPSTVSSPTRLESLAVVR